MDRTYSLGIIGRTGMYCHGNAAATPELAKLDKGSLIVKQGDRLGIYARERLPGYWTDSAGNQHPRMGDAVLIEAESVPGEWGIR